MRIYEMMLVLDSEMSKEQVDGLVDKVKQLLSDRGGEALKVERWGLKTLTYEIKRKAKGYYVLLYFKGNTELVSEMEKSLRLMEDVLRYLTVKKEAETFEPSHEEVQEPAEESGTGEVVAADEGETAVTEEM